MTAHADQVKHAGIYRALDVKDENGFEARDAEFNEVFAEAVKKKVTTKEAIVKVAIADSGIHAPRDFPISMRTSSSGRTTKNKK